DNSNAKDRGLFAAKCVGVQRRSAGAFPGAHRGVRVIVAGVMSGTSVDGINVALTRIQGRGVRSRLELLAHYQFPFPANVRRAVLAMMNASSASVADLSRLNF